MGLAAEKSLTPAVLTPGGFYDSPHSPPARRRMIRQSAREGRRLPEPGPTGPGRCGRSARPADRRGAGLGSGEGDGDGFSMIAMTRFAGEDSD